MFTDGCRLRQNRRPHTRTANSLCELCANGNVDFLGSAATLLERTFDLAARVTLCHILTLVVELFALAQPDLYLNPAVLEIHRHGDKRIAALLDLPEEPHYLLFV